MHCYALLCAAMLWPRDSNPLKGQDSDEEENDDYGVEVRPPKPFVDTPVFNMCAALSKTDP